MYIVSECLAGVRCRYDGKSKLCEPIARLVRQGRAIAVCPERLGGLPTPRTPCEICGGSGQDVLNGNARVLSRDGVDCTDRFVEGAFKTLALCVAAGASMAVLCDKSPSCGIGCIYDGGFCGGQREGDGVTAALLRLNGIEVIPAHSFIEGSIHEI